MDCAPTFHPQATNEARQWPDLARYQGSPYVTGAGLED
jgi:hypothetical protein